LLDATQIMSGRIALDVQSLLPQVEFDAVIDELAEQWAAKNISIEREYASADLLMLGDAKRVAQVLRNLCKNAIRFSQANAVIRLGIARVGDEVRLQVIDSGRGIDTQRLAALRGPSATDQNGGLDSAPHGNGMKLTLSQRLLKMQHGRLEIRSAGPDQGAEFTVYLPLAPQDVACI